MNSLRSRMRAVVVSFVAVCAALGLLIAIGSSSVRAFPGETEEEMLLTEFGASPLSFGLMTDTVPVSSLSLGGAITVHQVTDAFWHGTVTTNLQSELEPIGLWLAPLYISDSLAAAVQIMYSPSNDNYGIISISDADPARIESFHVATQTLIIDAPNNTATFVLSEGVLEPLEWFAAQVISPSGTLGDLQDYMLAREAALAGNPADADSGGGLPSNGSSVANSEEHDIVGGRTRDPWTVWAVGLAVVFILAGSVLVSRRGHV